jgi:hypothetical protein
MPVTFTVPITLISRGVTGQDGDGNDVYGEHRDCRAGRVRAC